MEKGADAKLPAKPSMNGSATSWGANGAGGKSKARTGKQLPILQSGSTGSGGGAKG